MHQFSATSHQKEPRMNRPLRLVLVRHGQSEANVLQKMVDEGESFGFPPEYATINDYDVLQVVQIPFPIDCIVCRANSRI